MKGRLPSRVLLMSLSLGMEATVIGGGQADAAQAPIGLGTVASFAVLAGTTVMNTGPSIISGI